MFIDQHTNEKKYVPSLRVIELEKEVRLLRKELEARDAQIAQLKQTIQDLQLLVADLQRMLFKKKKPKDGKDDHGPNVTGNNSNSSNVHQPRSKESFRRATPQKEEVTKKEEYTLDTCIHCGSGALDEVNIRTLYIEDIPEVKKEVIEQEIHEYLCCDCSQYQTAIPIPKGHDVILGPRVKSYVFYYTYILKTTYQDIIRSLWDYYHFKLSEGEIHYIQEQGAMKLQPSYNGIQEELLQQESVNMDETGWKIKGEQHYLWELCSPTTDATLLHIGSRGKGNAEELLKEFSGCVTTDCYGAYKNLGGIDHQVCWVHLLRNAKELRDADWLSEGQRQSARTFYEGLGNIYEQVKSVLREPYDEIRRITQQEQFIKELRAINQLQPCDTAKKLRNLKLLTKEYEKELFTCLQYKTALPENNLAERNLRHVVLKRKRSFGSQSVKGARIFAINCSVLCTLWKRFPKTFFKELQPLLAYG